MRAAPSCLARFRSPPLTRLPNSTRPRWRGAGLGRENARLELRRTFKVRASLAAGQDAFARRGAISCTSTPPANRATSRGSKTPGPDLLRVGRGAPEGELQDVLVRRARPRGRSGSRRGASRTIRRSRPTRPGGSRPGTGGRGCGSTAAARSSRSCSVMTTLARAHRGDLGQSPAGSPRRSGTRGRPAPRPRAGSARRAPGSAASALRSGSPSQSTTVRTLRLLMSRTMSA